MTDPRKETMKKLCIALLSSVLLCGCNAAKQTASFSCAEYPNGLALSWGGAGDQSCVTPSSASYQIGEQGSQFNSYSVSATLQFNPPLPTGTTATLSLGPVGGGTEYMEGQGQIVSTGSSTMNFSFTVTTNTNEVCLPNPVNEGVNVFNGDAGGIVQASWASVPQSCSN